MEYGADFSTAKQTVAGKAFQELDRQENNAEFAEETKHAAYTNNHWRAPVW